MALNDEVKLAVSQKRRAFEEWLQAKSVVAYANYRDKRKEVKRLVRKAKRNADARWVRRLCENFEENKMFWKEVKRVRKGENGREEAVKDCHNRVLAIFIVFSFICLRVICVFRSTFG